MDTAPATTGSPDSSAAKEGVTGPTGINSGVGKEGPRGNPPQAAKRRFFILPVEPRGDIRRNQRCPCGSGKKAKRCCLPKIKIVKSFPPQLREQVVARLTAIGRQSAPIPAAVRQRFEELKDRYKNRSTVPFSSGVLQAEDVSVETDPGTVTLNTEPNNEAEAPPTPPATVPPVA
jgi:hypothetical protein